MQPKTSCFVLSGASGAAQGVFSFDRPLMQGEIASIIPMPIEDTLNQSPINTSPPKGGT